MDSSEDDLDIKLQRMAGSLIADFDRSLLSFLRKQERSGGFPVRSRVRTSETMRLVSSLLEPFQELPQLLDPHLSQWLPALAAAFLEYQLAVAGRRLSARPRSEWLLPLSQAVCKILYTFCKIRGEKVIVAFLPNEARYLELLLSALENADKAETADAGPATASTWSWEERYVVLLWLSHLMLAPFDLATISSTDSEDDEVPRIPGLELPNHLPGIATRVLPLAIRYLASPGKERDAAKALLVRIVMRTDMQQLGVLDALVRWSLPVLVAINAPKDDEAEQTPYYYIGILSFLAGILRSSADTSDMDRHITTLFHSIHPLHGPCSDESARLGIIASSAVARKLMIKVLKAIAVLVLRNPQNTQSMMMVESTIGLLLESLADNDTPVRLVASKALSVIALRLDADMASQLVDAVLESLNKNVIRANDRSSVLQQWPSAKDVSTVDPREWHGLMLTLSHLLYRRSPPADNLSAIIHALLAGLLFEKRNPSGGSVGTNVRDAACFGVWALARRYKTEELLAVPAVQTDGPQCSILQTLATHLVVAACVDPAGNIRRGASAALQELIGRHPDTVRRGIEVVQVVDYHAVALRSRATQKVAHRVTKLDAQYGQALLEALLGWRGIGDADAGSRRAAAVSYGAIATELAAACEDPIRILTDSASRILIHIKRLQTRQVDERHGLFLCLAAVLDSFPGFLGDDKVEPVTGRLPPAETTAILIKELLLILDDCKRKKYRRPDLVAEAASRLLLSFSPLLQAALVGAADAGQQDQVLFPILSGPDLIYRSRVGGLLELVPKLDRLEPRCPQVDKAIELVQANLDDWLARAEEDVITSASQAALVLLIFCRQADRPAVIRAWANRVRHRPTKRVTTGSGYYSALAISYRIASSFRPGEEGDDLTCTAFLDRWASDKEIETRVSILQSLRRSDMLKSKASVFQDLIADGLDDYTTNARGDVGSQVRLEAIRATKPLFETWKEYPEGDGGKMPRLFLRLLSLASEKLDKLRSEAQSSLTLALNENFSNVIKTSTFSSKAYFTILLSLLPDNGLHPAISEHVKAHSGRWMAELMAGYVTSADTGNERLVIASRAALGSFCTRSTASLDAVCTALVFNLATRRGGDRVTVPTLAIIAFLFHVSLFARCTSVDYRALCQLVQRAGFRTGNVRKMEACVRVYGAMAIAFEPRTVPGEDVQRKEEGAREARVRLGALLFHPWPRVRSMVVDELCVIFAAATEDGSAAAAGLMGVDWAKAGKAQVRGLLEALGLAEIRRT